MSNLAYQKMIVIHKGVPVDKSSVSHQKTLVVHRGVPVEDFFVPVEDFFLLRVNSEKLFERPEPHKNSLMWNRTFFDPSGEFDNELTTPVKTKHFFNREEIEQRLLEIRQETEEICEIDNEVDMVHKQAYSDIKLLLYIINRTNPYIPMPDLDSADDGSLNATWLHKDNLITMGVYGNDNVIFTLYFKEKREVSGFCELSDEPVLNGFFQTLYNILNE